MWIVFLAIHGMAFTFLIIATLLGPMGSVEPELAKILPLVAAGLPLFVLMPAFLLHRQMGARIRSAADAPGRIAAFRGRMIVLSAMAEGPCLLAAVFTLLVGAGWHVIPAAIVQLGIAASVAPTASRLAELETVNHRGEN